MAPRTEQYYEKRHNESLGSPKDIRFAIYDHEMWQLCLSHINESDLVADYSLPTPSLVAQFLIDHNNNLLKIFSCPL